MRLEDVAEILNLSLGFWVYMLGLQWIHSNSNRMNYSGILSTPDVV
jgi:hypothetical protein